MSDVKMSRKQFLGIIASFLGLWVINAFSSGAFFNKDKGKTDGGYGNQAYGGGKRV